MIIILKSATLENKIQKNHALKFIETSLLKSSVLAI